MTTTVTASVLLTAENYDVKKAVIKERIGIIQDILNILDHQSTPDDIYLLETYRKLTEYLDEQININDVALEELNDDK